MKIIRFFKYIFIVCFLLASEAIASEDPVTLRFNFREGDVYNYSIEMDGVGEMAISAPQGMEYGPESFDMPMDLALYSEIEIEVKNVDKDKNADLDVYLNRFRVNTGPGMFFDSADDEEDLPPFLEQLFDDPVKMKMSPSGKILEIEFPEMEGMDEFFEEFFPMKFDLGQMISQSLFTLPENPVKPGDEWTHVSEVDMPMQGGKKIKIVYEFEMLGFEKVKGINCAVVGISIDQDYSDQIQKFEFPIPLEDEALTISFDRFLMDLSGKIYFAHREGIFIGAEAEMEQIVVGTLISNFDGEAEAIGMNLEFTADVTIQLQ